MSEGVSETSARRKIADLETESGCLVLERGGSLKLNQELLSQMFLQIQTELNLPNRLAEEQEQQLAVWKRKLEVLEGQKADEIKTLKSEIESYKRMVERQKNEFKTEKERYEWSHFIQFQTRRNLKLICPKSILTRPSIPYIIPKSAGDF